MFHEIERCFTGVPTLLILDEAWQVATHADIWPKVFLYLKAKAKQNVSVILSSQEVVDMRDSALWQALLGSIRNWVFLPNKHALNDDVLPQYHACGLTAAHIQHLAFMQEYRDYMLKVGTNVRVLQCALDDLQRCFVAASRQEEITELQALDAAPLEEPLQPAWLRSQGFDEAADLYVEYLTEQAGAGTNPNDLGVFVQTLQALQQALQPGMTLLRPVLLSLMGLLVLIEALCLAGGIMWLRTSIPASCLRFFFRTSVLVAVFLSAPALATGLVRGFTQLGLLAGNNAITVTQFMDPGQWLTMGFKTGQILLTAWDNTGYFHIFDGIVYLIAWLILIAAFLYMGFSLFILQLQMTVSLVGAQVLLPFAASRFTSWIGQGAIAYPVNMAFRFFFKALLACLVFTLLSQRADAAKAVALSGTLVNQIQAIVVMLILPCCFAILFLKSDSIAGGLLQGIPGLSVGNVLQAAVGGMALATGVGGMAMGGARLAAGAGGLALRGAAGAQTAYALGSATSTGGRLTQMAGGMQGVLQAAGGVARSAITSHTGPAMQQLRQTIQSGRQAGFVHSGGTLPASMPAARQAPTIARPGPSFGAQLRQTLQTSAYYLGNDHGHGGVTPHF